MVESITKATSDPKATQEMTMEVARKHIRSIFMRIYGDTGMDVEETMKWAKNTEKHIYNWTLHECRVNLGLIPTADSIKLQEVYKGKCKALICNLDLNGYVHNDYLLPKVVGKEITLRELVWDFTHRDYFPQRYVAYDAEIEEELAKIKRYNEEEQPDGALKCRRCKSMKTTYVMVQTRSADEPSTLKVQCRNCGLRWSQSA